MNTTRWVTDADGKLQRPESVLFDSLEWEKHPFLQSKIRFKPPIIETLAQEAVFGPGVLELLKDRGLTTISDLLNLLGSEDNSTESKSSDGEETGESTDHDRRIDGSAGSGLGADESHQGTAGEQDHGEEEAKKPNAKEENRRPEGAEARQFVSYVAVHPDEAEPDPDGLDPGSRMKLEAKAIELILADEPDWQQNASQ